MNLILSIVPIGSWVPFSPEDASSVAGEVDMLYAFLWALTIFFGVTISLAVFYFAIKYRRRDANEYPEHIEGSMKLESLWIIIPFIIAMGIFWWGASLFFTIFRAPTDPLDVYITGKQWMWKMEHPSGQREINELHVPVGRRVKLTMGTEDVIHSFFIPAFRVKADVVPGRLTTIWWEPTKPGKYDIFCAEYCGTNHSRMIGTVVVQEPSEYQAWLSGNTSGGSPVSNGEKLFSQLACNTCHKADKSGRGPSLEGKFGTVETLQDGQTVTIDENYVRESIMTPRAKVVAGFDPVMPTFQGIVSEEQVLQLIAYVKSLGEKAGSGQPQTAPPTTTPQKPATANSNTQKTAGATPSTPAKQEAKKK
jgi:cytochrome c oxidase subunit 2